MIDEHAGRFVIPLSGNLDDLTPRALSEVAVLLPRGTRGHVSFDLSDATFLDSSGLTFLISLKRRADELGITFDLINLSHGARQTLRHAGLVEHLNVCE